jgi:hypothetical protein
VRHSYGGVAFAIVLTAALAAALAAVGGVSYAATAVTNAAKTVRTVVVTHTHTTGAPRVLDSATSGGDQYKPGYGFGDPNHTHTGPPGLKTAPPGEKAPPPQTTTASDGKAVYVTATLDCDEQAALYFSVLDSHGNQLLLTQKGTVIGDAVAGPQTKTIHYVMLVPRMVSLKIRIPANLVHSGEQYTVRVIAVSPSGVKSTITIPFSV